MSQSRRADLKIGFACNNHCVFCAQGHKRDSCGAMDLTTLVTKLQQVRQHSDGLVLTGGEPILYKKIIPLIKAAKTLGFRSIQIQTNGRLLCYPDVVRSLIEAGATEFSPSIHGSTAKIHEALTCAEGSFDQSLAGIINVVKTGYPLVTNSVITKANVHDLVALVDLLGQIGVKQAQLAFVHPVGTAEELFDQVVPRLPDVQAELPECEQIAKKWGMVLHTEAIPLCFLRNRYHLNSEAHIPTTTVLDVDGRVANYSEWRTQEGKSHGDVCKQCSARHVCEGPWREYPDRFGWGEFTPLNTDEWSNEPVH